MEEGALKQLVNGPLGDIFDSQHYISDVSGSGNNWYGFVGGGDDDKGQLVISNTVISTRKCSVIQYV